MNTDKVQITSTSVKKPSLGSKVSKPDPNIVSGDLNTWMQKHSKEVKSYSSVKELENDNIALFNEYISHRADLYETLNFSNIAKIKKKASFFDDPFPFGEYLSSDWHRSDYDAFLEYQKARLQEWRDNNQDEDLPRDFDGNNGKSSVNPPDSGQNPAKQAKEKREASLPKKIQLEDKSLLEEESDTQVRAETQQVLKKTRGKKKIPRLPFPPLRLLVQAIKKREEEKRTLLDENDLTIQTLRHAEQVIREAEGEVRKFDDRKSLYVYRHVAIPDELLGELEVANQRVLDAQKIRSEAARAHFKVKFKLVDCLEREVFKAEVIKPIEHKKKKKPTKQLTEAKAVESLADLHRAQSQRDTVKEALISLVRKNIIESEPLQQFISKIAANDFDDMENILPKNLEAILEGVEKIKVKKLLRLLREKHGEVTESQERLSGIEPAKLVSCTRKCLNQVEQELNDTEERYAELQARQLSVRKSIQDKFETQISELSSRRALATGCYYKAVIENTQVEDKTFSSQRAVLSVLTQEIMQQERISDPKAAYELMLDSSYASVRKIGTLLPRQSLEDVPHEPFGTIIYAQQDRNEVVAPAPEESKGWQYRVPEELIAVLIFGMPSKHRLSCRIVANPDAIDVLDQLAKKYKFVYKLPLKDKYWNRADTITIYLEEKLVSVEKEDVAKSLQKFVPEGDDDALLGECILDSKKEPYKGVSSNEGPYLLDLVDLVKSAYAVDRTLGDVVSEYFNISESYGIVQCRVSPGTAEGVRRLLRIIGCKV